MLSTGLAAVSNEILKTINSRDALCRMRMNVALGLAVGITILTAVTSVSASTLTLKEGVDGYSHVMTYTRSWSPDNNYGSDDKAMTGYYITGSDYYFRTMLGFSLDDLPADAVISSVSLTVPTQAHDGIGDLDVDLMRLEHATATMVESEATWNNVSSGVAWATSGGDYTALLSEATVIDGTNESITIFSSSSNFVAAAQDAYDSNVPLEMLLIAPEAEAGETRCYAKWFTDDDTSDFANRPSLTLEYTTFDAIPGDTNYDGFVNEADAATLAANWLADNATWIMGDFNNDDVVDDIDATILATNWSPVADSAAVPEPSILFLFGIGGLMLLIRKILR